MGQIKTKRKNDADVFFPFILENDSSTRSEKINGSLNKEQWCLGSGDRLFFPFMMVT